MPRGEPPFFTSNPGEKPGRQLRTHSTVPGTVSASPAVAAPSVQDADAPKSPMQSKSSSKKTIESKKNSAASTNTVAPKSPRQSKSTKKKEDESYKKSLYWLFDRFICDYGNRSKVTDKLANFNKRVPRIITIKNQGKIWVFSLETPF